MFCSKCGKTIGAEDALCPSCNAPIGDNRFGGIPYTSAQFIIAPGQTSFEPLKEYTRTTYTGMSDATQEHTEVDSRTTYRPVYEGASVPKDVRRDMRAALDAADQDETEEEEGEELQQEAPAQIPQAAINTINALEADLSPDEEIDLSQFRRSEIKSTKRPGISKDVSEYIRKLESTQERRSSRRRSRVYDDYSDENQDERAFNEDEQAASMPREEGEEQQPPLSQDDFAPEDYPADDYDNYQDEDYDYDRGGRGGFNVMRIVKIAVAVVVAVALFLGVRAWINYVRDNQNDSPIEGVSMTLYEQGVAALKASAESTRVTSMVSMYNGDGGILEMQNENKKGRDAILALMPESPAPNDQLFMDALLAVYDNAYNAIVLDAIAVSGGAEDAREKSSERWLQINNSISAIENAATPNVLASVISSPEIVIQTETPAPTQPPAPNYANLSNGSEGDEVLQLQMRLSNLGFFKDTCDSVYGRKTQTAVKWFQEQAGLNATGIADSDTQNRLYAEDAPYAPGFATPTPAPTATPTAEPTQAPIQPAEPSTNS